jgi:putative DNA methylase
MVTFRLADSLPREVFKQLLARKNDEKERRRSIELMIDGGRGRCVLHNPGNAILVQKAFEHFDGDRYRFLAWVVMPNHVHVLIEQLPGHRLGDIVQSWKSFTAKKINQRVGANGTLWAPDYFDKVIRSEEHYANAVEYIDFNPVKAGLAGTPQDWMFSSASLNRD